MLGAMVAVRAWGIGVGLLLGCGCIDAPADSGLEPATRRQVEQLPVDRPDGPEPDDQVQVVETSTDHFDLTYTDATGSMRTARFEIRRPDSPATTSPSPQPAPVVVWSHGGGGGKRSTARVGTTWGRAVNQIGAVFVAVAHPGRTGDEHAALCEAVEVAECATFRSLQWDRLEDTRRIFDWLAEHQPELGMDRLVYGGHSAGAAATMISGGMASPSVTTPLMRPNARPIAFIAASPPGQSKYELDESSMVGIDRPMLLLTGDGDTTSSTTSADRRATFDLIDHDDVLLAWTDADFVGHSTFNLQLDPCRRMGGVRAHCTGSVRSLADVAQAFLDSVWSDTGFDRADVESLDLPTHITVT